MYTQDPNEGSFLNFIILATAVALCVLYCRRRQLSTTAFGTAVWAYDELLRRWGMLSDRGLILGRTLSGSLIRIPRYTHVLLIGGTGSGKGVGLIIPNMLSYADGSVICFDPKGELYRHTSKRRARMGRIIRLSPFGKGGDRWNMLDTIPKDSLLIDRAKALAESLVVRPPTGSSDPHWDSKAAQIITSVLVFVLTRLPDAERNLNSLHDIVSDPEILNSVAHDLKEMGGIPGRLGGQISSLLPLTRPFS